VFEYDSGNIIAKAGLMKTEKYLAYSLSFFDDLKKAVNQKLPITSIIATGFLTIRTHYKKTLGVKE